MDAPLLRALVSSSPPVAVVTEPWVALDPAVVVMMRAAVTAAAVEVTAVSPAAGELVVMLVTSGGQGTSNRWTPMRPSTAGAVTGRNRDSATEVVTTPAVDPVVTQSLGWITHRSRLSAAVAVPPDVLDRVMNELAAAVADASSGRSRVCDRPVEQVSVASAVLVMWRVTDTH